jgi:stearoyl-CoA desaturase (delta-9 desaturase)
MKNWWKHLNLLNIYLIIGVPLMGLYGAWYTPLQKYTLIWSVVYYFNTGLGITAGM